MLRTLRRKGGMSPMGPVSGLGRPRLGARPGGGALVLVLLTTTVLLIMGTAFLFFLERDYRFAGYQERSEQAWFLALAGLEYYQAQGAKARPPLRRAVPLGSQTHFFEVQVLADGTVISRGIVQGTLPALSGTVVERSVIAPRGVLEEAYDASL